MRAKPRGDWTDKEERRGDPGERVREGVESPRREGLPEADEQTALMEEWIEKLISSGIIDVPGEWVVVGGRFGLKCCRKWM